MVAAMVGLIMPRSELVEKIAAEKTLAARDQVIEELHRQLAHERDLAARPWWRRWLLG
jgi:hypothetical protein